MNQALVVPMRAGVHARLVWVGLASLAVSVLLFVASLMQGGGPASGLAPASIAVAPAQSSVSLPAAQPGNSSPYTAPSPTGGHSINLADIELNTDPNCVCSGAW